MVVMGWECGVDEGRGSQAHLHFTLTLGSLSGFANLQISSPPAAMPAQYREAKGAKPKGVAQRSATPSYFVWHF